MVVPVTEHKVDVITVRVAEPEMLHVPPVVVSDKYILLPAQTLNEPLRDVMGLGIGLTLNVAVVMQPPTL